MTTTPQFSLLNYSVVDSTKRITSFSIAPTGLFGVFVPDIRIRLKHIPIDKDSRA